jgi:hypothetical protein
VCRTLIKAYTIGNALLQTGVEKFRGPDWYDVRKGFLESLGSSTNHVTIPTAFCVFLPSGSFVLLRTLIMPLHILKVRGLDCRVSGKVRSLGLDRFDGGNAHGFF